MSVEFFMIFKAKHSKCRNVQSHHEDEDENLEAKHVSIRFFLTCKYFIYQIPSSLSLTLVEFFEQVDALLHAHCYLANYSDLNDSNADFKHCRE